MRLSEVYEYIILLFLVRSKETIFEIFVNMILWAFPSIKNPINYEGHKTIEKVM